MKTESIRPKTIDDYIALQPAAVQKQLHQLRATIMKAAPRAEETIKYGMPTFVLHGNLVYFSAWKNHIGFYPRVAAFKKELSAYDGAKGTVKFYFDEPLPLALVGKIVRYRIEQNKEKLKARSKKKTR